jgi:HAD superfamily hydrolase (TIGR01509 family)
MRDDTADTRLRQVQGLIFDLDGTLLALAAAPGAGLARWLARLPGLTRPDEWARRLWVASETPVNYGMLLLTRTRLERLLGGWIDAGRRLKGIARHAELQAIPGAVEAVAALAQRYAIAVVTNRGRRDCAGFLERSGLAAHVRAAVTRDDVWRLKPHPAPLLRAARGLGLPVERTLLVGDMPVDMRAARRGGAFAVGVESGFCTEAELRHAGAQRVLPSVRELHALLRASGCAP